MVLLVHYTFKVIYYIHEFFAINSMIMVCNSGMNGSIDIVFFEKG